MSFIEHRRTNCVKDAPGTPSLMDRFVEALKTVYPNADKDYFNGFSMPEHLLQGHISIGCLKCQLCNEESHLETGGVFAWDNFYFLVMDEYEDWGTKIHIYSLSVNETDQPDSIFTSGKVVSLEKKKNLVRR